MITGLIILEDTVLKFDIGENCNRCQLTISDSPSGKFVTTTVNNEQLGAIIGTAICGTNEKVMEAAGPLVHEALDHLQLGPELFPCPL